MKLIKLSLAAAVATGAFCGANAIALEDAITNIETSGMVRYRYQSDRMSLDDNYNKVFVGPGIDKASVRGGYNGAADQYHNYKAYFNFKAALDDNFKVYVQFEYHSNDHGFYNDAGTPATIKANGKGAGSLNVKQMYFEYTNADLATKVTLGKQQIGAIWTDDEVGSGVKIFNNSIEHITLAAFWFDDYDYDDMSYINGPINPATGTFDTGRQLISGSTYGGAIFANYDPFSVQLWGAYNNNLATLYAINADYHDTFFGDMTIGFQGQYLGNSVQNRAKNLNVAINGSDGYYLPTTVGMGEDVHHGGNGQFFAGKLYGSWNGIDLAGGYYQYGKKDKFTITTIEDVGSNIIYAGESLIYSTGSGLTGGIGRNEYFFATAGYTFDKFHVGVDYVGGTTDIDRLNGMAGQSTNSIDKNEVVGRLGYKYSPKLDFTFFYSWYQEKGNMPILDKTTGATTFLNDQKAQGNFIRFQTKYTW